MHRCNQKHLLMLHRMQAIAEPEGGGQGHPVSLAFFEAHPADCSLPPLLGIYRVSGQGGSWEQVLLWNPVFVH